MVRKQPGPEFQTKNILSSLLTNRESLKISELKNVVLKGVYWKVGWVSKQGEESATVMTLEMTWVLPPPLRGMGMEDNMSSAWKARAGLGTVANLTVPKGRGKATSGLEPGKITTLQLRTSLAPYSI